MMIIDPGMTLRSVQPQPSFVGKTPVLLIVPWFAPGQKTRQSRFTITMGLSRHRLAVVRAIGCLVESVSFSDCGLAKQS